MAEAVELAEKPVTVATRFRVRPKDTTAPAHLHRKLSILTMAMSIIELRVAMVHPRPRAVPPEELAGLAEAVESGLRPQLAMQQHVLAMVQGPMALLAPAQRVTVAR